MSAAASGRFENADWESLYQRTSIKMGRTAERRVCGNVAVCGNFARVASISQPDDESFRRLWSRS